MFAYLLSSNAVTLREYGQRLLAQKRAASAQTHRHGGCVAVRPNLPHAQVTFTTESTKGAGDASAAVLTELDDTLAESALPTVGQGWLAPLSAVLNTPVANPISAPATTKQLAETVAINPALLAQMVKQGQTSPGRLWLLCRGLDQAGRGVIAIADLRQQLTDQQSYYGSWRRIRQVLAQGEGVFWVQACGRDNHKQLYLAGAATVAKRLNVQQLARRNVMLPTDELLVGTQRAKAVFYAAFHAGRASADQPSNPIARATIAAITGLSERSQRTYDKVSGVETKANYALTTVSQQGGGISAETAWQHGHASFAFTDHHGRQGATAQIYSAVRLPNSYRSPLKHAAHGRRRKISRQLNDDLVTIGAQGNVNQQYRQRIFHRNGRQAIQASQRQGRTVYLQQHSLANGSAAQGGTRCSWWQQLTADNSRRSHN